MSFPGFKWFRCFHLDDGTYVVLFVKGDNIYEYPNLTELSKNKLLGMLGMASVQGGDC